MYRYRRFYEADVAKAGVMLPLDQDQQMPPERLERATRFITERQQGRMALVGSTEAKFRLRAWQLNSAKGPVPRPVSPRGVHGV